MNNSKYQRPGISASLYKPLSDADIHTITEAAFEVLSISGMKVYSKTALEAFRNAGADVDLSKKTVKLPRSLVEDAIDSNPSSITLYSRDGKCDAVLEDSRVHYGTGGTAIYVIDRNSGKRRKSKTRDVINNARMVQALENVHVFTINVFPHDIKKKDEIDVNRFYHSLNSTTKHVMGGVYSLEGCKKVIGLAEMVAGSPEALRQKPFVSFITLIISPFKIDKNYGEITCYLAKEGLPVVVPTEPICGTTSPITLAGNILTHIAETLAGIALVQSVRKGAPGICGSVGSISDLTTMGHLGGPIERAMINAAVAQLAQHFQIPLYSTGGTSDAKEMDIQAAYESALSSALVAMSGANYIHDIAGLMETDLTVSYDKLAVDNEILGMIQRVLAGIEVNDETLALDLLIRKGPGKDFLAERHTIEHMRDEFYFPKLTNRASRENYQPGSDTLSRAKEQVSSILDVPMKNLLPEDVRTKILSAYPEIKQV